MNVSFTINDARDAAIAAVLCSALSDVWGEIDRSGLPEVALTDHTVAAIEPSVLVPVGPEKVDAAVVAAAPARGRGRPRKEKAPIAAGTVIAAAAEAAAAPVIAETAEMVLAPPEAILVAAPAAQPEVSVDDLRKQVADLYHADGKGLLWLTTQVLENGKYKCLSDVPEDHLRAILAAG